MSTLTKVFIVLLVVFSIAFTTMSVSLVAQMTDWRETAEKYEEHARVADANLRHLIAANAAVELTCQHRSPRFNGALPSLAVPGRGPYGPANLTAAGHKAYLDSTG